MIKLAIVTPCLNEEEVLPISAAKLLEILDGLTAEGLIDPDSRLIVVNDGSTDGTWRLVEELHARDPRVAGVDLMQNSGHQAALLAGMSVAREIADAVVTIDSDLQDDPNAIREMVIRHQEGAEVVYGVRSNRDSDTFLKRNTAHLFYAIMRLLDQAHEISRDERPTADDIDRYYTAKEQLEENRHFVSINHKQTLAQVFTDIRYTKSDNEAMSATLLDTLRRQGFC